MVGREPDTRGTAGSMTVAWYDFAHSSIELVQDDDPDSPVARFVARHGGGLYYLGLNSDDPRADIDGLRSRGARVILDPPPDVPYTNQAFVHPASAAGVLIRVLPIPYRPRPATE